MSYPKLEAQPTREIGPYRLAHRFAVGGMAEVFRALWPQSAGGDRAVVIKRLRPDLAAETESRRMFEREIALGRQIAHPNVVAVLDHGHDGGVPYLVLEYVFGVDLARLTKVLSARSARLPVPLAVWIGTELLAGLDAVHRVAGPDDDPLHIVHRDVSPSNVFLSVHGEVKLGDLGIAREAMRPGGRRRDLAARAKGKIGYLPPEQVAGFEVDQRGDVFSAAVVIAELLIGRPLFGGATEIGVLLAIRDGDLSALRAAQGSLPVGLVEALVSGLERSVDSRLPSAEALRRALLPFAGSEAQPRELGRFVALALDELEHDHQHRGALAETVEKDGAWFDRETPPPPTMDAESAVLYRADRDGETIGTYALGELVGAISTGVVGALDVIHYENGRAETLAAIPELARYLPSSTRTPSLRERTRLASTSEIFELSERSVLGILAEALAMRHEGLLLCEQDGVRKEVYLSEGAPSFVTSNRNEELLGESLVRADVIAREELDLALAVMPRFEGRLGETLVALGLVDPVELFRMISEQVREKVVELFEWRRGTAALYRDVEPPERGFPLASDPFGLLEEGAQRRLAAGLEPAFTPAAERRPRVLARTALDVDLPDRLARIATACEVPRSLGELVALAPEGSDERARVLVLVELGALEWRSPGETT
ncbi:MAG: protein kinase [Sandaracinaceae bacterium]